MKFNNTILQSEFSQLIHTPFKPAEIRIGDPVLAEIQFDSTIIPNLNIWRLSPLGVEIICSDTRILINQKIKIILKTGNQISNLYGVVVEQEKYNSKIINYVRLTNSDEANHLHDVEKRRSDRWICSDQFYPTAIATNPAKFSDVVYFKIKDISSEGFKLTTSLRNKFIFKGMVFSGIINFPMITQINAKFKISSVRIESENEKDFLSIGAEFDKDNKNLIDAVTQYLLQFSNVNSLDDLRRNGLNTTKVSDVVSFGFVKTKEEYDEVLELRRVAYVNANKVAPDVNALEMADQYDAKSRIIIGKYKNKIICSSRLLFCELEDSMELEKYIQWPLSLPRRDSIVEVTRACTALDFRQSDLLMAMLRFIALTVVQSKRQYIAIWATDSLLNLYSSIGFEKTDLSFNHTKLNNLKHNLMIADVVEAMMGKNLNPISWCKIWSPVADYLNQYDMLNDRSHNRARFLIFKILKPLSEALIKISSKKFIKKNSVLIGNNKSIQGKINAA